MTGNRRAGSFAAQFFGWLLLAYPKSFRDCFGDGMRYAFVSRMEEVGQSGRGALTLFWMRGGCFLDRPERRLVISAAKSRDR